MLWDLSHRLENDQPHFSTHTKYFRMMWNRLEDGDRSAHGQLIMGEHSGTHVDAPCHFFRGKDTIDVMPLESFMGTATCVDLTDVGPDKVATPEHFARWDEHHGRIQSRDVVLLCYGHDRFWATGASGRAYAEAWPGLSEAATEWLLARDVKALGTDAISIDSSRDKAVVAHQRLLGQGVVLYENLTRLGFLVGQRFWFSGVPLRIGHGTGSPVRAWALIDEER